MRLLCEYSDGTTVSLPTALQKNPYEVRGLVTEAFFQCLAALPDTSAFLRTEHAIRDAISTFEGTEDRYIKPYVTSRFLDARTRTTRASIIQSSFSQGGPIALIGTFYATFNASRNVRSREALEYLLEASEESRDELFRRASAFPLHSSTTFWFQKIVDRLESDARSLAYFLASLGPTNSVPNIIFTRMRQPSLTWGIDGEIVMHYPDIAPFLSDESRFASALEALQWIGLVRSNTVGGANGIHVDQGLAPLICDTLVQWRTTAAKVICYVFPKHPSIEPERYTQQCKVLLPFLQHSLSSPFDGISHLQTAFLFQAIEACLSSLDFGEHNWKLQAISKSEHLLSYFAGREQEEYQVLQARVAIAKAYIRQQGAEQIAEAGQGLNIIFLCDNPRSHAFSAELVLLRAQAQIDLNNLEQALQEASSFNAPFRGSLSTLGTIMDNRIKAIRGTILRYSGRFLSAFTTLSSLPPTDNVILHLSAVLCERGECDTAIKWLDGRLQLAAEPKPETLQLAWAHAHLFKCMQNLKGGQKYDLSLQLATTTYLLLSRQSVQHTLDFFSILVGQAIIFHIQRQTKQARKAWSGALSTLQSHGLPTGYLDVLLLFSLSDLACIEQGSQASRLRKHQAEELLAQYPASYRFLGLGSLWPAILHGQHVWTPDIDVARTEEG
ncbi:hypothetical protein F4802DRAFT_591150 [Xylaria palmicola]|nr:hypothetical protein F4802DRAFT_591150 [Xylaria palmicola]